MASSLKVHSVSFQPISSSSFCTGCDEVFILNPHPHYALFEEFQFVLKNKVKILAIVLNQPSHRKHHGIDTHEISMTHIFFKIKMKNKMTIY